jgi:hypothetical protein
VAELASAVPSHANPTSGPVSEQPQPSAPAGLGGQLRTEPGRDQLGVAELGDRGAGGGGRGQPAPLVCCGALGEPVGDLGHDGGSNWPGAGQPGSQFGGVLLQHPARGRAQVREG